MQRVREGGKFPCAEMASEEKHTFAARHRLLVIFHPVVDNNIGDIFPSVGGELAELGELASQGDELSAKDSPALVKRHCWERERKIAQPDRAQARMKMENGESNGNPNSTGDGAGKLAQQLNPGPDQGELKAFSHCAGV
jgi:hypothetical protein